MDTKIKYRCIRPSNLRYCTHSTGLALGEEVVSYAHPDGKVYSVSVDQDRPPTSVELRSKIEWERQRRQPAKPVPVSRFAPTAKLTGGRGVGGTFVSRLAPKEDRQHRR